jgi:hypothetical protein
MTTAAARSDLVIVLFLWEVARRDRQLQAQQHQSLMLTMSQNSECLNYVLVFKGGKNHNLSCLVTILF